MASTSSLRRTRRGFLIVSLVGFVLALGLGAWEWTRSAAHAVPVSRAEPPKTARPVPPQPVAPAGHEGHAHLRAPNEAATAADEATAPPQAAAPQAAGGFAADLPLLSACASLSAALIAFLGFVITSVMTLRKERRESALFAVELEMKRMQLETMRAGQHVG